jgi:hypothetical protein
MLKLFQGEYQKVQADVDTWVDVYKPKILDFRQSMVVMEHNIVVLLTVLYETVTETEKVQYKISGYKK